MVTAVEEVGGGGGGAGKGDEDYGGGSPSIKFTICYFGLVVEKMF